MTPGRSPLANDCDDTNAAIHPGAIVCGSHGTILVCGPDGVYQPTSCPGQASCHPQPNGTGVCL